MQLVVGRVGRPHGVRGEVAVEVHTDEPQQRYAAGATLDTDPPSVGPLTVVSVREHHGRLLVRFAGVEDRTAAGALRGVRLVVDAATSPPSEDPDEFWDHELEGLAAQTPDGAALGVVDAVLHTPGQDLLVVRRLDGTEALVPFVAEVVTEVDVAAGRLVVDPPEGLLEL